MATVIVSSILWSTFGMRMKTFSGMSTILTALVVGYTSVSGAQTPVKLSVSFNCVFRYTTSTTCEDVKREFFSNQDRLASRVENFNDSELRLIFSDESISQDQIQYSFKWGSDLPSLKSLNLEYFVVLPQNIEKLTASIQLREAVTKGFLALRPVVSQRVDSDGQVVVTFGSPKESTPTPDPKKEGWLARIGKSPWVITTDFGQGNYNSSAGGGFKMFNTPVGGELAYVTDKFKTGFKTSFNVMHLSTPDGTGGRLSGSMVDQNYTAVAIYSLTNNWNVAFINTNVKNPSSNIENGNSFQSGVEWTLVPFRDNKNQNHELAFRMGTAIDNSELSSPNYLNHIKENYLAVFSQIYLYWVTKSSKFNVTLINTVSENLKYKDNFGVNTSANARYQMNQALTFMGIFNYNYSNTSLTYPLNPDFSNPLQSQFLRGQSGHNINLVFGVNVSIGNSPKKNRDRRWAQQ